MESTIKDKDLVIWKADNSEKPYIMQVEKIMEDGIRVIYFDMVGNYQTLFAPSSNFIKLEDHEVQKKGTLK